jgi:flagellar biosynthesis/type III secretory pathway chaperone
MSTTTPTYIDRLVETTSRLITVMQQEIDCLRRLDTAGIATLREEKEALVAAYEDGVRQIAADPEALKAMAPAFRAEFHELAQRFDRVVTENSRALTAVRDTQERMLKAIVDAVADSRAKAKGYSCTGAVPAPAGGARNARLSLTLDRRL